MRIAFFVATYSISVCLAASSRTSSLAEFLRIKRSAVLKVFIDSNVEAPEADVQQVLAKLPSMANSTYELFPYLRQIYAERCRELLPDMIIGEHEVCPCAMDCTTDFENFVMMISKEQAFSFFSLPPGSFRDAVREHLRNFSSSFINFETRIDSSQYPYWEALHQEKSFFEEFITEDCLPRIFGGNITISPTNIPKLSVALFRINLKHFSQNTLLAPAIVSPTMQAHLLDIIADNYRNRFHLCLPFQMSKLVRPLPSSNKSVMKRMGTTFMAVLEQAALPARTELYFEAIVGKVLEDNPEALFLDPSSLELPAFSSMIPFIASAFLEAAAAKECEGTLSRHIDLRDQETVSFLDNMILNIDCRWNQRHYRRVLRFYVSETAQSMSSGSVQARPTYYQGLPWEITNMLVQPPAFLNKSFRISSYSKTLSNPHIFFKILTESYTPRGISHIIAEFKSGYKSSDLSLHLANLVFDMVLSEQERFEIDVLAIQRNPGLWFSASERQLQPNYKQRVLLNSLMLKCGPFSGESDPYMFNSGALNVNGPLEVVASIFFPQYMNKLKTAASEGLKNIEEMLMCPFIDKGWLLEYYGNIDVPIDNPTCILRLLSNEKPEFMEELTKYIAQVFTVEKSEYDTHSVRTRIVELIRYLKKNDDMEMIFRLVRGLTNDHATLIQAMQVTKEDAKIKIGNSKSAILVAFLADFWVDVEAEECTDMIPVVLCYPRRNAVAALEAMYFSGALKRVRFSQSVLRDQLDVLGDLIVNLAQYFVQNNVSINELHRLLYALPTRKAEYQTINRLCDLENNVEIMNSIPLVYVYMPEVSLKLKLLHVCCALQEDNTPSVTLAKAIFNAWWPIFKETGDSSKATRVIIEYCGSNGIEVTEDFIESLLVSNFKDLPGADNNKSPSTRFHGLSLHSPASTQVPVYVDGRQLWLPSTADCTHLYAVAQMVLQKSQPFRLIRVRDGMEVLVSDHMSMQKLANDEFISEPVNIFIKLFEKGSNSTE